MPYLLRRLAITRPNQVWSIDIIYIPMLHGFMYLTAIIDVYSRCIMAWGLHKTIVSTNRPLDRENSIEVLRQAVEAHGAPEIINSDQGSQYKSSLWLSTCEGFGIKVSMDGRGRCKDNIWIERFWRTIKTEHIYIRSTFGRLHTCKNPEDNVPLLRQGIRDYIEYYNNRRSHHRALPTRYRWRDTEMQHERRKSDESDGVSRIILNFAVPKKGRR
jgi:putative transposase